MGYPTQKSFRKLDLYYNFSSLVTSTPCVEPLVSDEIPRSFGEAPSYFNKKFFRNPQVDNGKLSTVASTSLMTPAVSLEGGDEENCPTPLGFSRVVTEIMDIARGNFFQEVDYYVKLPLGNTALYFLSLFHAIRKNWSLLSQWETLLNEENTKGLFYSSTVTSLPPKNQPSGKHDPSAPDDSCKCPSFQPISNSFTSPFQGSREDLDFSSQGLSGELSDKGIEQGVEDGTFQRGALISPLSLDSSPSAIFSSIFTPPVAPSLHKYIDNHHTHSSYGCESYGNDNQVGRVRVMHKLIPFLPPLTTFINTKLEPKALESILSVHVVRGIGDFWPLRLGRDFPFLFSYQTRRVIFSFSSRDVNYVLDYLQYYTMEKLNSDGIAEGRDVSMDDERIEGMITSHPSSRTLTWAAIVNSYTRRNIIARGSAHIRLYSRSIGSFEFPNLEIMGAQFFSSAWRSQLLHQVDCLWPCTHVLRDFQHDRSRKFISLEDIFGAPTLMHLISEEGYKKYPISSLQEFVSHSPTFPLLVPSGLTYWFPRKPNANTFILGIRFPRPITRARVWRNQPLLSMMRILRFSRISRVCLGYLFHEEEGVGQGVAQEFYTIVGEGLLQRSLGIWRCEDMRGGDFSYDHTKESNQESSLGRSNEKSLSPFLPPQSKMDAKCIMSEDNFFSFFNPASLVDSSHGVYPRPLPPNSKMAAYLRPYFVFLGRHMGYSLNCNRIINVPFSIPLLRLLRGDMVGLEDIRYISYSLYRTLKAIAVSLKSNKYHFSTSLASSEEKQAVLDEKEEDQGWLEWPTSIHYEDEELDNSEDGFAASHDISSFVQSSIKKVHIETFMLTFVLPGDDSIELIPGGRNIEVTGKNMGLYLEKVLDFILWKGVQYALSGLRDGLSEFYSFHQLRLLTPEELHILFAGSEPLFSLPELIACIKPTHGYSSTSPQIMWLYQVLVSYSKDHQRKFLRFLTGTPRLPIGGLPALVPEIQVARKTGDVYQKDDDDQLPSAMTCQNYLKLPAYSSYDILKEKLSEAITEGSSFFGFT